MLKEIQKALASDPQKELVRAHNLIIRGEDIRRLDITPGRQVQDYWLSDQIIDFYLQMIQEGGDTGHFPKVLAFTTYFYDRLKTSLEGAKRWVRKTDIFSFGLLLIPHG